MAQLPPKIPPTMTQNWPPAFPPHQRMPSLTHIPPPIPSAASHQQPYWVGEFLDFTASRRGNHRRSVSDSVTFLEAPAVLEGRRNSSTVGLHGGGGGGARYHHRDDADNTSNDDGGFDRLDDEQLMSMFSDDISAVAVPPPPTSTRDDSNPSSPNSDQNSNDKGEDDNKLTTASMSLDQQQPPSSYTKTEPADGVVESSCNNHNNTIHINGAEELRGGGGGDGDTPAQLNCNGNTSDPNNDHSGAIDPKRAKRILANRQSAQRSRVRKLQYISELERSVAALQTEVSALSPRVAFLDHQRLILSVDNSALKQRIAALAQDKIFKDAHQEALKKEIERLRKIYEQQHMKKMADNGGPTTSDTNMPACAGKEQLMA